jgi:hypothetical protein
MRRALVPFLVVLAALAAVAPSAGAAAPRRALSFELHADGFQIQGRSALGSGRVRLMLDRGGEVGYYSARARLGARTVKARFGRLGSLDFRFVPARREAPLGCGGRYGAQYGIFKGSLIFRGEHDYADVDAGRAKGWFQTHPVRHCGHAAHGSAATPGRAAPIAETGAGLEAWSSFHLPFRFFAAFTEAGKKGPRVAFNALLAEHREGMQIDRGVQLYAGARSFAWDLGAGTATLEPPAPFTGRAFFRREPGGKSRWWGSLRAPILGGRPMRVTGSAFNATLGPGT